MAKTSLIAKDGTRYSFGNEAGLQAFINEEIAAWSWIFPWEGHALVADFFTNIVNPLRTSASQFSQDLVAIDRVKAHLQPYFNFEPQLHQKAPMAGWIQQLSKNNPVQAFYALAYLLGDARGGSSFSDVIGGQSSWVSGITKAIAYKSNWRPGERAGIAGEQAEQSSQAAADALAASREIGFAIAELHERIKSDEENRAVERAAVDSALVTKAEELVSSIEQTYKERSESLAVQWTAFNAEFNSQLALKAPSSYWKLKHQNHTKWVWRLGMALSLGAALGAWVLHEFAWEIFGPLRFNQIPSWFQVITFSLATLVYVLILRSTLRLLMSHVHLSLDSAERQTMIVSYLALARRGGITEDSLDKILASIFRPTGDGIIKDEGVPLSVFSEMFKR